MFFDMIVEVGRLLYRTGRWNWKQKDVDESNPSLSELAEKLQDKICTIFFSHFFLWPRNVCRYPKLLLSREKMHFCQKHCYTLDVSDTSVFDFKGILAFLFLFFLGLGCATEKKILLSFRYAFFCHCIELYWHFHDVMLCQYRLIMIQALKDGTYISRYVFEFWCSISSIS